VVVITETECVYCAVRTVSLYTIRVKLSLEGSFSFMIVSSEEYCMVHAVYMCVYMCVCVCVCLFFVALLFEIFFAAIAVL